MTNIKRKKIEILNEEFKESLGAMSCGDSNLPIHIFGSQGIADWELCAAYIDWYLEMYDEIDEAWRYERMTIDSLEGFLKKFRDDEESFDLVEITIRFDYLLELLILCRNKTLGRIECSLLKEGIAKIKEDKKMTEGNKKKK